MERFSPGALATDVTTMFVCSAGLFGEWFDEWIFPDRHFLQVKLDYSDLEAKLRWALDHDEEARKIAEEGQRFAHTRLRNEDMSCYLYRLLLEYAAILER